MYNKTKTELNIANRNYEEAEGDLIDYYLYQIKAHKAKLDYLIKEVKEKGFSLDTIHELNVKIVKRIFVQSKTYLLKGRDYFWN